MVIRIYLCTADDTKNYNVSESYIHAREFVVVLLLVLVLLPLSLSLSSSVHVLETRRVN